MTLVKAIATIGGLTGLSRITGLMREILMSHFLGAGIVCDAFIVAFKFPNFFRRFFAEGAFNAAFVPLFAGELETKGKEAAHKTATDVFRCMALFLALFSLLVVCFAPQFVYLMAPGFATTPERLTLAIDFIRITFPYIFFISLSALLAGILNSLHKFALAAAAPIFLNLTMIGALLLYRHTYPTTLGYALSWSLIVAGIFQLGWLYVGASRRGYRLSLGIPTLSPSVRKVMTLMGPGIIGAGVMQINIFIDMFLASFLPSGALSYLYYADRLSQLPLSIFGVAIGTALLPLLSKQIRAEQITYAHATMKKGLFLSLQLTLPAAFGLIVLCFPLIDLIYGHGMFDDADVHATAPTLAAFALGLPAYVLGKVLQTCFFAQQDTKTPVYVAIVSIIFNLGLNLILIRYLAHVGLALSTALAAWVNFALLGYLLSKEGRFHFFTKSFAINFIKILGASLVMAGSLVYLQGIWLFPKNLMGQIFYISSAVSIGIGIFGGISYYLGTLGVLNKE